MENTHKKLEESKNKIIISQDKYRKLKYSTFENLNGRENSLRGIFLKKKCIN